MARINPPPPVAAEFGQRVRTRRTELGLTQMQLAEQIELHFTFVSSIERGQRNPTLTTIIQLANGLGLDPGNLIAGLDQ